MKFPRRKFLHLVAGAAALAAISRFAWAQAYPTRTVNIIVAFPPGGPSEGVVRLLAEKLSLSLGRPVVIENRPGGAGGSVGTRSVVSAAPDGHTLLLSPPGPLVVAPLIYKNVGYDPTKAFNSDHGPLQHPANVGRPSGCSREICPGSRCLCEGQSGKGKLSITWLWDTAPSVRRVVQVDGRY